MNYKKILGIITLVLCLALFVALLQSINCGTDLKFGEHNPDSCFGMEELLEFIYFDGNIYILLFESILIITLLVIGMNNIITEEKFASTQQGEKE